MFVSYSNILSSWANLLRHPRSLSTNNYPTASQLSGFLYLERLMKLSLKDLETVIQSQLLYSSLCIGAQGQVPDEPLQQAYQISSQGFEDLVAIYRKRTNDTKTDKMLKRCEARLGFASEDTNNDNRGSSVQDQLPDSGISPA